MSKKDVPITYRKSFLAKFIMSDDKTKEVYTKIKNKLMSIKGMKSRISWFYDAFNIGSINFAKLSVRGKYVALYLNLDVDKYPLNIYHQEYVGDRRRFSDTSFKIHVSSERSIKYATKLIDDEIAKYALKVGPIPNENYFLDYEDQDTLVERGLIKLDAKEGTKYSYDINDVVSVSNKYVKDDYSDEERSQVIFIDGSKVFVRIRRSFEAKLIQSDQNVQRYYSIIKNAILAYTNIKSRTSWKYEAFSYLGMKLAKFQIRGTRLCVYFNLDYKKYKNDPRCENSSKYELFEDTPLMIRVKDDETLEFVLSLIPDLKRRFSLEEGFIKDNQTYEFQYQDNNTLIQKGLIKVFAKFGDYQDEFLQMQSDITQSKKNNNFPVYKEVKNYILTVDDANNFVEREEITKVALEGEREVVYIDEIIGSFKDGDTITLDSLKEKGLLQPDTVFYKIAYRGGTISKKLAFIAQAISPLAYKAIINSGCTYVEYIKE